MQPIVRTETEIDELLDMCHQAQDEGSAWPGMTYEEGIEAVILWLRDRTKANPLADD